MVSTPIRVLILEDRSSDTELIVNELRRAGFDPDWVRVETEQDYLTYLDTAPDIILADYHLPQFDAPRALELLQGRGLDIPFIVVTGVLGDEVAVELMKRGAADYLLKDRLGRLGQGVLKALEQKNLREQRQLDQEKIQGHHRRQAVLRDINLAVTSSLDHRAVLNVLMEKIDVLLPYSGIMVWLLNKESGVLEQVASRNLRGEDWKERGGEITPPFLSMVLQDKAPVVVRNIQTDPRVWDPDYFRKQGLVSYVGIPMKAKGEILGVLSFGTKWEHQFNDEEIEFLVTLAGEASIAIHNSRLFEQVEQRTHELSALHGITVAASQSLELEPVLQEVIKKLTEIFLFDCTRIFLFDNQMDKLHLAASFEILPEFWAQVNSFRRGQGIVGMVAETGEPFICEDTMSDPRYREMSQTKATQKAAHKFFAVFPIKSKTRIVGTIICIGQESRRLTPSEVQLIMSMVGQIGISVENATLFQETVARAKELSALYAVATEVNRSLDLDILLRSVMHKVLEIFHFDAARIYRLDAERKDLRLIAHHGFSKDATPAQSYPRGTGVIGRVFETGEPLFFEDIQNDPEFRRLAYKRIAFRAGFRGGFFIPIRVKDETEGVMNILSKEIHHFSPGDIQLIHAIADHLGIALLNASLYEQTKTQAQALQRSNMVKDQFLSVMSHELRTPLSIIMGHAGMTTEGILGNVTQRQKESLNKIMRSAEELLTMVNGIMEVTKLEAEVAKVERIEFGLEEFLGGLETAYSYPLAKEFTLTWNVPPNLPVIRTDREKLRQILQNLINNAIKFTEKGSVTISAQHHPVTESMEFKVADTGIGISKETLPLIFEKFRQLDSSNSRSHGGAGLGLYIVKHFSEMLGGTVRVESELGRGSTFVVTIPTKHNGSHNKDLEERNNLDRNFQSRNL
jgi:signal transduction histidine kinase/DNA-binding response OmpR family regulator